MVRWINFRYYPDCTNDNGVFERTSDLYRDEVLCRRDQCFLRRGCSAITGPAVNPRFSATKSCIGRKYGAFDQMDSRGENYMEVISCRSTGGAALEGLQEIVVYHVSELLNHNYLG